MKFTFYVCRRRRIYAKNPLKLVTNTINLPSWCLVTHGGHSGGQMTGTGTGSQHSISGQSTGNGLHHS